MMGKLRRARTIAWLVLFASLAAALFAPTVMDGVAGVVWIGSIVALLVIQVAIKAHGDATRKPDRKTSAVALIALIVAALDVFFFQQFWLSGVLCIAGVLYYLPRAIGAYPDRTLLRLRLIKAVVTLATGAAAIAAIVTFNLMAQDHARTVIAAAEAFKAKFGRYPDRLDELVPAFLPEVPNAKPAGMMPRFLYYASADGHTLMYTVLPPFGRRLYTFEEQRWSALD